MLPEGVAIGMSAGFGRANKMSKPPYVDKAKNGECGVRGVGCDDMP